MATRIDHVPFPRERVEVERIVWAFGAEMDSTLGVCGDIYSRCRCSSRESDLERFKDGKHLISNRNERCLGHVVRKSTQLLSAVCGEPKAPNCGIAVSIKKPLFAPMAKISRIENGLSFETIAYNHPDARLCFVNFARKSFSIETGILSPVKTAFLASAIARDSIPRRRCSLLGGAVPR